MTPVLTTLANFNGASGQFPDAGLIAYAAGDLFGMTATGGAYGYGAVFELVNNGGAGYTPVTLLSFSSTPGLPGSDSGVIADAAGNLFGTIPSGGAAGDGAVFELVNNGGAYTQVTLLSFNGANGALPSAGLIADAAGNLFGTTASGGAYGYGTVFEIAKAGAGYASTPTTLFSFDGANGAGPVSGLIADAAGDLFGTTPSGGGYGYGAVFELVNNGGVYTPVTLLSFDGADGRFASSLITDAAGDLFGTTSSGGAYGYGTVFELVNSGGAYTPVTLLSFNGADGANPGGGLIADAAGDLFGTTGEGGAYNAPGQLGGEGTVFELVNNGGGSYTPVTLLSFDGADGAGPVGGLIADAAGDLFGATAGGGVAGDGTAFEITHSGFVTKGSTPPPATSSDILWRNREWRCRALEREWLGGLHLPRLGRCQFQLADRGNRRFQRQGRRRHPVAQCEWRCRALERKRLRGLHGSGLGRCRFQLADRRNRRFQRQGRRRHPVAQLRMAMSRSGTRTARGASLRQYLGVVGSGWQIDGTGDFNGEGEDGILWRNCEWRCRALEREWLGGLHRRKLGRRHLQLADRREPAISMAMAKTASCGATDEWRYRALELERLRGLHLSRLGRCQFHLADRQNRRFHREGEDGILWRNSSSGAVELWNPNGSGGFTYENLGVVNPSWQIFKHS